LITQLTLNDAKGGIMTQTEAQTKLPTGKWVIDPVHSSVAFSIRHMIAARAKGRFNKFKGSFNIKDPIEESTIEVEIDAASVDTSNEQRDNHLRSPDFLDVEKYPKIIYKSDKFTLKSPTSGVAHGQLTIRDKTLPVDLNVELIDVATGLGGKTYAGFTATTEINRHDWEVKWNTPLETGGLMLGDKVKIEIDVEASLET
jgi:polyisoprenoid-binding protein YceI